MSENDSAAQTTETPEEQKPSPVTLVIKQVGSLTVAGQVPTLEWSRMSTDKREAYFDKIRGSVLAQLRREHPNHFYDFLPPVLGEPTLATGPDKRLIQVTPMSITAAVFLPVMMDHAPESEEEATQP